MSTQILGEILLKILVIEDDVSIQKAISKGLTKFGYAVDTADDGEDALELLDINKYDGVVLDLNLPKVDGIDVLKEIRKKDKELNVLILSARSEIDEKILGLDAGANDYMEKPFNFRELEARLRALLRRKFIQTDIMIYHGDIKLDTALKSVYVRDNKVDLTKKEYGIFEYLLMNKNRIISAEEIIEHIWNSEADLFSDSFKVHINSLKKKLAKHLGKKELIKNTRGVGYYIMEADNENI